jgi:hypothetical protein
MDMVKHVDPIKQCKLSYSIWDAGTRTRVGPLRKRGVGMSPDASPPPSTGQRRNICHIESWPLSLPCFTKRHTGLTNAPSCWGLAPPTTLSRFCPFCMLYRSAPFSNVNLRRSLYWEKYDLNIFRLRTGGLVHIDHSLIGHGGMRLHSSARHISHSPTDQGWESENPQKTCSFHFILPATSHCG